MLTTRELLQTHFQPAFRGYDRAEVDAFLHRLISEYETLLQENAALKARIQSSSPQALVQEQTANAEVAATDVQTTEADERVTAANARAEQAEARLAAAEQLLAEMQQKLAAVGQEAIGFHRRMRNLLGEYAALLDQGEEDATRLHDAVSKLRVS